MWLLTAMPRLAISALHDLRDQWYTAATGGSSLGTGLHFGDGGDAFANGCTDLALADIVAGADLGSVWQRVRPRPGLVLPSLDGRIRNSGSAGRVMPLSAICSRGCRIRRHCPPVLLPATALPSSLTTIFL